jgi:hypothetical protein
VLPLRFLLLSQATVRHFGQQFVILSEAKDLAADMYTRQVVAVVLTDTGFYDNHCFGTHVSL